jgi:hypothetical protein
MKDYKAIRDLQRARERKADQLERARLFNDGNITGHLKALRDLTTQQLKAELEAR